ncbi:MAG: hypothetical protein GX345_07240 [Clostridiales bacterium]|nr:hypothetical protein [Clostridiales bacterium]
MSKRTYFNGSFIQRIGKVISVADGLPSNDISALTYDKKGLLYIGTGKGLVKLNKGKLESVDLGLRGEKSAVNMLFVDADNALWAACDSVLFYIKNKSVKEVAKFSSPAVQMAQGSDGALWLLTRDLLYKAEPGSFDFERYIETQGQGTSIALKGLKDIFVGSKKSGLLGLIGKRPHFAELFEQFTGLLSNRVNCVSFDSVGYVWVGTDKGVNVYDGKGHWLSAKEVGVLPKGDIRAMDFADDGSRWFATDTGLVLLKDGSLKYYGFRRWVPSVNVKAVAVAADGTVAAGTDAGLSIISQQIMTLNDKADHYQKVLEKYHVRKDGFVTLRILETPYDMDSGYVRISDNDGTWTAMYLVSQAYRYGTTGEKSALANARQSYKALKKLAYITDIPGFTARAIRYPDEVGFGNGNPEWHLDAKGECEWKCETSSDEMVGVFYGLSVYYDIAADKKEKEEIKEIIRAIMDHILENNYKLVDFDGLPTTWANWAPEDINYNDHWFAERGTNALELLSMLKVAHHMTGKDEYDKVYRSMISDHRYLMNCMHYKLEDYHSCHIDDELAMLSVAPLLKYEKDPMIRSYLLMGLEHHWQYERIERTPLWSTIYGSLTGKHCDIELAAESLELLPLDLIHYPTYNSHREDLEWIVASEEFWMPPQLKEPLPYDEKPTEKYDANPFLADYNVKVSEHINEDGSKTRKVEALNLSLQNVEDGTVFLHPYWMARYYGLLSD